MEENTTTTKDSSQSLFALVDADYQYVWIDVGTNGCCSDAQLFNRSDLKACIEDGTIGFPAATALPGEDRLLPYYLLGDDAFALRTWLMKPYSKRNMTHDQRIFNYRLSRGRRIVENVFGITVQKFQVLLTTMRQQPEVVTKITLTCCILHNLLCKRHKTTFSGQLDSEDADHNLIGAPWRQQAGLQDASDPADMGRNTGTGAGKRQRLYITDYLS